ncbi:hypothetical protein ACLKA6_005380 [Drosophila palustris]
MDTSVSSEVVINSIWELLCNSTEKCRQNDVTSICRCRLSERSCTALQPAYTEYGEIATQYDSCSSGHQCSVDQELAAC